MCDDPSHNHDNLAAVAAIATTSAAAKAVQSVSNTKFSFEGYRKLLMHFVKTVWGTPTYGKILLGVWATSIAGLFLLPKKQGKNIYILQRALLRILVKQIIKDVTVQNRKGLHARASVQVVKLAETFKSSLSVCDKKTCVSALSIMDLLMLGAAQGTLLTIKGEGEDSEDAVTSLVALIENKFGEI